MSMMKCNSQNQEGGGGNESNVKDNLLAKHKFGRHPYPSLPTKLVVAIDGWAHSGKNTTGELVAEAIQGVLVDSGRFYRAFTRACIDRGINLDAEEKVAEFCWNSSLDCRLLHDGGRVMELQVAIGGRWFTKEDLNWVANDTSKVARVAPQGIKVLSLFFIDSVDRYRQCESGGCQCGTIGEPQTPFYEQIANQFRVQLKLFNKHFLNGRPGICIVPPQFRINVLQSLNGSRDRNWLNDGWNGSICRLNNVDGGIGDNDYCLISGMSLGRTYGRRLQNRQNWNDRNYWRRGRFWDNGRNFRD